MYHLNFDNRIIGKEESSYKLDRISPSMISSYLSCPLAFYYGYIAKIELPTTRIHLSFGSAVHGAIEAMYNDEPEPYETFKKMFKREDLDPEGQTMFSEYYVLGLEMLKNYFEDHKQLDAIYNLKAGKQEFRFKRYILNPLTGEPSSIPISGVLDRITDAGKIIEYKTSKTKWDPTETRFKVQSLLYNLWYFSEFGELADETLYLILLKKHKRTVRDETLQIIPYKPTVEDLAGMWYEVECIIAEIEAGHFDRPKTGHANYCDCKKYEALLGIRT